MLNVTCYFVVTFIQQEVIGLQPLDIFHLEYFAKYS